MIAISVYVLVAIIKKQLRLEVSLHTLLQILSLTLFEKLPLQQAVVVDRGRSFRRRSTAAFQDADREMFPAGGLRDPLSPKDQRQTL